MPTLPGMRRLERRGIATVFRSPSKTRQGLFHLTVVFEDGSVLCSCEGFCFQGHCWHLDDIPLCLQKGPDPKFEGRIKECHYVQQHKGDHSWGPQAAETEAETALEESQIEQFDPLKGLPQ